MAKITGNPAMKCLQILVLYVYVTSVVVAARVLPVHPYMQSNEKSISNIFDTSKYGILQIKNGLADAPQMGWNTWNFFACSINETVIKETADALISTGFGQVRLYPCEYRGGSSSGNSRVGDKISSTLLTEMDGLEESKGVLVLAATNLVDAIDPTLRCPGQFDEASI